MINQYKRTDVYRCRLQSHGSFAGKVSAYHVLKVRACLPEGCIYFKWRCRLLEKGASCAKGYNYPGKNCNSCRYYYEDKLHKIPEVQLEQSAYRSFLAELEEFESWLGENLGRRMEIYGRVNHLGPRLVKTVYPRRSRLSLRGYLLNFAECFLDRTRMEDFVYLPIGRGVQERLCLARGDLVTFEAELTLDEGRLVLKRPGRWEIDERGPEPFQHQRNQALVDAHLARPLENQSERCINCERGRLVDVYERELDGGRFLCRELHCLEGVVEPDDCCYNALKKLGIR